MAKEIFLLVSYDYEAKPISFSTFNTRAGAIKRLRLMVQDDIEDLDEEDTIDGFTKNSIANLDDNALENFAMNSVSEPWKIIATPLEE